MEKRITKLTLENRDDIYSWETPYNDTLLKDIIQAFYGICVSMTYDPNAVLYELKDFAEEKLNINDNEEFSN